MMSEYSDLQDMIDVLTIAIAREESEERFFRRSCKASTHKIACEMFEEIAGEYASHSQTLESRRQVLMEALEDLKKRKKE
jgi:rubrerythrin